MVIVEYCRYGNIYQYMLKRRGNFFNQITPEGRILSPNVEPTNTNYENMTSKEYDGNTAQTCNDDGLVSVTARGDRPEELSNDHGDDQENRNNNNKLLCTSDLLRWSFQVARGMEFLASKNVLHGDLAARNILLAEDNIVKICDFGLARNIEHGDIYKKQPKHDLLPVKWMALESIRDLVFSTESDVWSFGIALWEMFSLAATPYPTIHFYDLLDRLTEGYRMERPTYANSEIYKIMSDCWEAEPVKRPSFADLSVRLGDILQECTQSCYVSFDYYASSNNERLPSADRSTSVLAEPTYNNLAVGYENQAGSLLHDNHRQRPLNGGDIEMGPI